MNLGSFNKKLKWTKWLRLSDENKKPSPTSVWLPKPLKKRLAEAVELTDESQSSLMVLCTEKALDAVVKEIMERKHQKALKFFDKQ